MSHILQVDEKLFQYVGNVATCVLCVAEGSCLRTLYQKRNRLLTVHQGDVSVSLMWIFVCPLVAKNN